MVQPCQICILLDPFLDVANSHGVYLTMGRGIDKRRIKLPARVELTYILLIVK